MDRMRFIRFMTIYRLRPRQAHEPLTIVLPIASNIFVHWQADELAMERNASRIV